MEIIIVVIVVIGFIFFLLTDKSTPSKKKAASTEAIQHKKQEYLATENEKKLLFALQKALKGRYLIHCQTSLIAIVDPVNFKDKSRAYSKRMDFVITDAATKILAVIELDDASHNQPKRIKRDKYVNAALKPHHPLIRIPTEKFYSPEKMADILEKNANIKNEFNKNT
ncbi:hypothetical protein SPONN_1157 [uncultured Candidatus Thioglobus sp.]|nr:hypothetical protein SPONN_1157 [uncultured Candidatus Thioglobus sp.]